MATYSTYGNLFGEAPYVPIIKVKDWDIKIPENIYVTGSNSSDKPIEATDDRKELLIKLTPWYKTFSYTWSRLQAADLQMVSNDDLAFLLDLAWNLSKYYPEYEILFATVDVRTAFRLEVTEFIIQGYSPADAQKKARESIKAGKFVSKESLLATITNMSAEQKKKLGETWDKPGGYTFPGQVTEKEQQMPAQQKRSYGWIIAGVLILILTKVK